MKCPWIYLRDFQTCSASAWKECRCVDSLIYPTGGTTWVASPEALPCLAVPMVPTYASYGNQRSEFRVPHKQINKAWREIESCCCCWYVSLNWPKDNKYYISRQALLSRRRCPTGLRRRIAFQKTDHSAVRNKPVMITWEYRKFMEYAFKIK